jgi:hypothetical protein
MGRHRAPRRAGLPPLLSGAAAAAALVGVFALVQPPAIPQQLALPAPAPAVGVTTSAAAPTTTATTRPAPSVALTTTRATAPRITVKPVPTTKPPVVKPPASSVKPKAQVAPAAAKASAKCSGLGVLPQAVKACEQITAAVPGITVIYGRGSRAGNPTSCHPLGLALDLMVYRDKALGDRVAAYVRAHKAELGVTTILWQVKDHFDHVHASLLPCRA